MKIIAITPDKKRDYTTELIVEGFNKLGVEIVASDIGNGIDKSFSDQEIVSINDADFVIAFFGKVRNNNPPKHYLIDLLKDKFKIVYVDGSEWTYTGYQNKNQMLDSLANPILRRGEPWINEEMFSKCDAYFKRECYEQDFQRGIIPLPFGLMERHLLHNDIKDIDVMCVFGQHMTGLRKQVTEYCLKINSKYKVVVANDLNPEIYKNVLSRSRIVIDAWGGGDNCDRFWEAIGSGSCCLYQKYNTIVENQFIDFQHAVSYNTIDSFIEKINLLLESKSLTSLIGQSGKDHGLTHHTSVERAKKIIEKVKLI
jgi:hypothetical protein